MIVVGLTSTYDRVPESLGRDTMQVSV